MSTIESHVNCNNCSLDKMCFPRGLSQEEIKLINYSIINIINLDVDNLINDLKNLGIIFYLKKKPTIFRRFI